MAVTESPTSLAVSAMMKSISDLENEKNFKFHFRIYETLTELSAKRSIFRNETCYFNVISIAIPITLQDISTGNDNSVVAALSFLGVLLQVVTFPLDKQLLVVEVLTEKLNKVSDKNQSRKLMWSLANIQFDYQLPESHLKKMLQSSIIFLQEKPPIVSLSLTCESLNNLCNVGLRNKDYFEKQLQVILTVVFPWLFNETDRIRELSLRCLMPFSSKIAQEKLLDTILQGLLWSKCYGGLTQLILGESNDSLKIWSFLIQAFGAQLHNCVPLLKELLKIKESALKSKNPVYRQCALEHWKYIIDCFALNPVVLNSSKAIRLVLAPLTSTNTSTENFCKTKIELWWHLLNRLGPNATQRFQEVTLPLLTFCFGSVDENQQIKKKALDFLNIIPLATTTLAGILSQVTEFKMTPMDSVELSRSYTYLSQEDFRLNVEIFSQFSLQTLNLKSTLNNDNITGVYKQVTRSFIERCCSSSLTEPLKGFIRNLLEIIASKPAVLEVVFDTLTAAFNFSHFTEMITVIVEFFLLWFVENEPLPAHPLVYFLTNFFEAGITWNVARFTANITNAFDKLRCYQDHIFHASFVEQWSILASALIAKNNVIHLPNAHLRYLLFPLTCSRLELDEGVFVQWSTLLSMWAKKDPSVIEKVLNIGVLDVVDVEETTVRFVLSALRPELSSYCKEISSWVNSWTASWLKLADIAQNKTKCTNLFVNFLTTIIDELKEVGNPNFLLTQIKTFLQGSTLSKEVSLIIYGVFGHETTAISAANVQKLRKHNDVCNLFSTLVQQYPLTRNELKQKTLDDFVVKQPHAKAVQKGLHQDEMQLQEKSTCNVPATNKDIFRNNQTKDSTDTQAFGKLSHNEVAYRCNLDEEEDSIFQTPKNKNVPISDQSTITGKRGAGVLDQSTETKNSQRSKKAKKERFLIKETAPKKWKGKQHIDDTLKKNNCIDINELFRNWHVKVSGNSDTLKRKEKHASGFYKAVNGIMPEVVYHMQPKGIYCQEDGHLNSQSNIKTATSKCQLCVDNKGAPVRTYSGAWKLPPLIPIDLASNIFVVVLLTRSSSGEFVASSYFTKLRNSVISNNEKIRKFLFEETGDIFDVHIFQEAAAKGSMLSLERDMHKQCQSSKSGEDESQLHLPSSHIADIFKYYAGRNVRLGYMVNSPMDLNGKLSNYVDYFSDMEVFGVNPESIIYMTYGIEVEPADEEFKFGVRENFTIYTGKLLLQKIDDICKPNSDGVPHSTEATIDGVLSSLSTHTSSRYIRLQGYRKTQGMLRQK